MALSKQKQSLIAAMKKRGFSNEELERHIKKSTIAQMRSAIDNDEAHIIIANMATKTGTNRIS